MKKTLISIFIFFTILISISSQSITITNPNGISNWIKGQSYIINWNKSGTQNTFVKIRLYNCTGNKILNITNSTSNNGNFGP